VVSVTMIGGGKHRPLIQLEPKASPPKSLVIVCHGLGDTAFGWFETVAHSIATSFASTRFILPTAPTRPITLNRGFPMPGWYDIASLDADRSAESADGLPESQRELTGWVKEYLPPRDSEGGKLPVVLMGFSQGGALSLYTVLQLEDEISGCVVLSGYLPDLKGVEERQTPASAKTPIHFCHGTDDEVVLPSWGEDAFDHAKRLRSGAEGAASVTRSTYDDLGHGASMEEIREVIEVLKKWIV
jgi:predicted esterase